VDEEQQICRKRDIGLKNFLMEYPNPSSLPLGSIAPSISASQFIELNDDRKRNPLYGLQGSLLKCARCNQSQPVNTHRFLDISLFFEPPYPRVIRLQDCLRLYTAPEPVHGTY
jgi:hypothetical protein